MSEQPEQSIVNKIRALLRKTEDSGATPQEADAAMQAAMRLMAKHGIEKMIVDQEDDGPKRLDIVKERVETGRDKNQRDPFIMTILERCFGVRALYSISWERIPAEKLKNPWADPFRKRMVYVLIGDRADVDMAKEVIYDLNRIMRNALEGHLRETGKSWNAVTAKSYWRGMAEGYISENKVAREEALLGAGKQAAGQYALAVVDKKAAIDNFIQTAVTVRPARRTHAASDYHDDYVAADAGRKQGAKLNLKNKRLGK